MRFLKAVWGIFFLLFFSNYSAAQVAINKSIGATKHNLSTTGSFAIKSEITTEICVFCHTPHSSNPQGPAWNRRDPGDNYITYESKSLNYVTTNVKPDGSSKLCLSCHDGSIALDDVLNLPGAAETGSLQMIDSGTGKLTVDKKLAASQTGYTSNLGVNLTNDHPISFVYNIDLVNADGELRDPASLLSMDPPLSLDKILPLDKNDKLQCTSCHDPHTAVYPKFLRVSIQQTSETVDDGVGAMICLYCHTKKKIGAEGFNWIGSTHQALNLNIRYGTLVTGNYLVPLGKDPGMEVWKDGCLMCHDTHTVEGGKRLLLEGTDASTRPRNGGNPASEETCYLCHTTPALTILDGSPVTADIKSEFASTYRMPITTDDQPLYSGSGEIHDIKNSDLEEIGTEYYDINGVPNFRIDKRHVECSDCHNPHRIIPNSLYTGTGIAGKGTHEHSANTLAHRNTASGVLLGSWGVEPVYGGANWSNWPGGISYDKKGVSGTLLLNAEYQLCLKCHSSYAFGTTIPTPGGVRGGSTPLMYSNELTSYTDQAKEFNGSNAGYHPVIQITGRTLTTRNIQNTPFLRPWTGNNGAYVGDQTMYCSDCHGKDNTANPDNRTPTEPLGPHGSNNPFLLIGKWDFNTGTDLPTAGIAGDLCFKCHDSNVYAYGAASNGTFTGFKSNSGPSAGVNLHGKHMGQGIPYRKDNWEINNALTNPFERKITCMTCHDAVMHGGGGTQQYKGRNLLTAFKAKGSPCTPSSDPDQCIDQTLSDEKPYRTSRSRLRVEDREIAAPTSGWATSGSWVKENCEVAHNGTGTAVAGCLPTGVILP